ncbi:MAG: hypothetical protein F6J90_03790 [Moorea sp. SIOASIH]|nr:hypothetical protein [Moorena sp. SIOASIH]
MTNNKHSFACKHPTLRLLLNLSIQLMRIAHGRTLRERRTLLDVPKANG